MISARPFVLRILACAAIALPALDHPAGAAREPVVTRVVLLIGDGFGPSYVTLARGVAGSPLALDPHLVGAASTEATDQNITDSGAAATAMACGVRTRMRSIGVDDDGHARLTLLESARDRGRSTGLVTTTRLTHATPACFAAHVRDRGEEDEIAAQMVAAGVDVLLGGGARHFEPAKRKDGRDLLAGARERGVTVLRDLTALRQAGPGPILGLFADSHLDYVLDRDTSVTPSLEQMTQAALTRLARDPDGFFLMVEGGRIDHAGHANDAGSAAHDALEFDRTFARVLEFARREGNTLVVVTADHETGGLTLGMREGERDAGTWEPQVLRRLQRSAWSLAESLNAGADAATLFRQHGAPEPTTEDLAAITSATPAARTVAVARWISTRARVGWTTLGHTAVDVPVWAYGPGAEQFRGSVHLAELGLRIAALAGTPIGSRRGVRGGASSR